MDQDDNRLTPEELERNRELYRQVAIIIKEQQKIIDRDCGRTKPGDRDYPMEPYMRFKDIAAEKSDALKQQQEQEWSNNMSMGVPEVISKETNDMTAEQVLEFLEKCPLTIDVNVDIQKYWFRKPTTTTTISFLYKGQTLDASKFIKLNSN